MSQPVTTPTPPYYAVLFTSIKTGNHADYGETADRMVELAAAQPGFLGYETAQGEDGLAITLSYWRDEPSIISWKRQIEHARAQQRGKAEWYAHFELRVAKVERATSFKA